jgi:hypothetical protein
MIVCAAASTGLLSAQNTGANFPASQVSYQAPVGNAGKPDSPKDPCNPVPPAKNIDDGTKAELACEWIDPNGVLHTLKALEYYTVGDDHSDTHDAAKQALCELIKGRPGAEDLYRAAQGWPDAPCAPYAKSPPPDPITSQGLPDFLDSLEKANTLGKKAPADEDQLFSDADKLICDIFTKPATGKQELSRINDYFSRKQNQVALFRLLDAYPKVAEAVPGALTVTYAKHLETLRAAYEMNISHLALLVAQRIAAATK